MIFFIKLTIDTKLFNIKNYVLSTYKQVILLGIYQKKEINRI